MLVPIVVVNLDARDEYVHRCVVSAHVFLFIVIAIGEVMQNDVKGSNFLEI